MDYTPGMGDSLTMDELLGATAGYRSDFEDRAQQTIGLLSSDGSTGGERAVDALAGLTGQDAVEVRETLGQGGMAVVRLGHQASLGRDVAVKMLRPDRPVAVGRLRLLREAWVTGTPTTS